MAGINTLVLCACFLLSSTSAASLPDTTIEVIVTCDNELEFYGDGILLVANKDVNTFSTVTLSKCTENVAIKCVDLNVVGGIQASFSNGIVTDGSWKCTNSHDTNWLDDDFDDSGWKSAHQIAKWYSWWPKHPENPDAYWIWTDGWRGIDRTVYCRKHIQDCPDNAVTTSTTTVVPTTTKVATTTKAATTTRSTTEAATTTTEAPTTAKVTTTVPTTTTAAAATTTTTTGAPATMPTTIPTTETPTSTGYDCHESNPCNPSVIVPGKYYYQHVDPTKFVQCGAWGECYEMPCSPGLVWDPVTNACNWP